MADKQITSSIKRITSAPLSGSNFVTFPGIIVLFCLAVLANYYHYTSLSVFLGICGFVALLCFFWNKQVLNKISCSFAPSVQHFFAFPEQELSLSFSVTNQGLLPILWVNVLFFCRDFITLRCQPAKEYRTLTNPLPRTGFLQRFTWMLGKQTLTCELLLEAKHRGYQKIQGLTLSSGDGFGLSVQEREYPLLHPISITVFPRLISVSENAFLRYGTDSPSEPHGLYKDVTLLEGSRPYQYGDSTKHLNWRLLAGKGILEVNQYEKIAPSPVCFYLDFWSFHGEATSEENNGMEVLVPVNTDHLEHVISYLASLIVALSERHVPCMLLLPGFSKQKEAFILPETLPGQETELLTALAKIAYSPAPFSQMKTSLSEEIIQQCFSLIDRIYIFCETGEKLSLGGKQLVRRFDRQAILYPYADTL